MNSDRARRKGSLPTRARLRCVSSRASGRRAACSRCGASLIRSRATPLDSPATLMRRHSCSLAARFDLPFRLFDYLLTWFTVTTYLKTTVQLYLYLYTVCTEYTLHEIYSPIIARESSRFLIYDLVPTTEYRVQLSAVLLQLYSCTS